MTWRPSPAGGTVLGIAVALVGNMATNTVSVDRPWWNTAVWTAVAVLATTAVAMEVLRASGKPDEDLHQVTERLAAVVRKQWQDEVARRALNDPYPLPVRWLPAPPELVAGWTDITRLATSGFGRSHLGDRALWAASADELADDGGDLVAVWRKVPTGRLVVLGGPGSGKTMVLARFVVDLLDPATRVKGSPVPVLISVASWNPDDQDLPTWLAERLAVDHPALDRKTADGTSLLRRLLDEELVFMVLDGLDEIPESLRAKAVAEVNKVLAGGAPLVVSSRTDAYRDATRPVDGVEVTLTGAAGIRLRPLDVADVVAYLRSSAGGPAGERRWDRVAEELGRDGVLAETMVTPLMTTLARVVHNPTPGVDPTTVPSPDVLVGLPDREAIEQHLFDGFVPAAYRPHPTRPTRWRAELARKWLGHLAWHLHHNRSGLPDLAWWQLHLRATPRSPSRLAVLTTGGVVALVAGIAAVALHRLPFLGSSESDVDLLALGLTLSVTTGLVFGTVRLLTGRFDAAVLSSVVTGLAGGLAVYLVDGLPSVGEEPEVASMLITVGLAVGFAFPLRRHGPPVLRVAASTGAAALVGHTAVYAGDAGLLRALNHASVVAALTALLILLAVTLRTARRPRWPGLVAFISAVGMLRGFTEWLSSPNHGVMVWVVMGLLNVLVASAVILIAPVGVRPSGHRHRWPVPLLMVVVAVLTQGILYNPIDGAMAGLLAAVVWLCATGLPARGRRRLVAFALLGIATAGTAGVLYADAYHLGIAVGEAVAASVAVVVAFSLVNRDFRPRDWLTSPLLAGFGYGVVHALYFGPVYGVAAGVVVGLAVELIARYPGSGTPAQGRLRFAKRGLVPGVLLAVVVSAFLLSRYDLETSVLIGAIVGCAVILTYGVEVPRGFTAVRTPARVLARDRAVFLVVTAPVTAAVTVAVGFVAGHGTEFATTAGLLGGLTYGVTTGIIAAAGRTQWLHYVATRWVLALTGRAPWRLMTFLAEAHTVHGVLRQNGATYQFRHLDVQRRLAATHAARLAAESARRGPAGRPGGGRSGSAPRSPQPIR